MQVRMLAAATHQARFLFLAVEHDWPRNLLLEATALLAGSS